MRGARLFARPAQCRGYLMMRLKSQLLVPTEKEFFIAKITKHRKCIVGPFAFLLAVEGQPSC